MNSRMYICSDQSRGCGHALYVSHKRGDGGKDWGYTDRSENALPLTDRMAKIYLNELGGSKHRKAQPYWCGHKLVSSPDVDGEYCVFCHESPSITATEQKL